ncbi:MAG: glycosyl hydrolase family 28-related protein [Nitrospiraceae bacterium]|nr:glycosyl hydrolase family 28-related protein [Nitrospiraceae bacterium]
MLLVFLALAAVIGFAQAAEAVYDLPANRKPLWQGTVGIPGGVPARTACTTLSPSGGDDQPAIQAAINSCAGKAVVLNAGIFSLSSSLSLKSNVTLRGAGPSQTILSFSNGSGSGYINFLGSGAYDPPNYTATWTSGYTKGTTVVTLSSVNGLAVGSVLFLDQTDDNATDVWAVGNEGSAQFTRSGNTRHKVQAVSVTAISGTSVTITPPLYGDFAAAQSPGAFWYPTMITMAGVESLKIDPSADATPAEDNVFIQYANAVWVKNVESYYAKRAHVRALWAKSLEIRDSYFHHSRAYAQESYGMEPWFTSASLIENNVFDTMTMPLLLAVGTSGNVLAYNYSNSIRYDPTAGWLVGGTEHDAYAWMNLFEGNILQNIYLDNAWGSNGYTTIFRNSISGWQSGMTSNTYPIVFQAHSRNNSIVGNVLGTAGYHNLYEIQNTTSSSQKAIYEFGYWSSSGSSLTNYDTGVYASVLRHMNYDVVSGSVKHCDTDGGPGCQGGTNDVALPVSLYLAGKPAWWGGEAWPPIGPDVAGYAGNNPAKSRYEGTYQQVTNFTVTPSAGANGAISPATAQLVATGSVMNFTVTPGSGYTASVGGTCGGTLTGTTYTTNAVTANCTVTASFAAAPVPAPLPPATHIVTPSAGPNGSISPATAASVNDGATTQFTVTPLSGYSATVGGTCGGTLSGTTYTTNAITADCTVVATFSALPGAAPTKPSPPTNLIVQ